MARKSFQKGTVIERRYDYGTTYIARWREKNPEGQWREKSKTLRDCPDKKTAQKELDQILRDINRRNGVAAYRANVRFNEVLNKHWPNYLKSADVKPSTQGAWKSSIKNWVPSVFSKMRGMRVVRLRSVPSKKVNSSSASAFPSGAKRNWV